MAHRVVILPSAEADLEELDAAAGRRPLDEVPALGRVVAEVEELVAPARREPDVLLRPCVLPLPCLILNVLAPRVVFLRRPQ